MINPAMLPGGQFRIDLPTEPGHATPFNSVKISLIRSAGARSWPPMPPRPPVVHQYSAERAARFLPGIAQLNAKLRLPKLARIK